ncbi:TonB-dependent receptor domain-containing protein [Thalassotalea ganghwensis]
MKSLPFPLTIIALAITTTAIAQDNLATKTTDAKADEYMVISASRVAQPLAKIPASVSVVDQSQIERFVLSDLANLFKYDPSITSSGNAGQAQTLTVRGIGGNRLVYIQDGRRLNDSYAGGGGFIVGRGYLDTDNIKQIEIAKGAASSLYGSDALGGIVVIQTKNPRDFLGEEQYFSNLQLGTNSDSQTNKMGFQGAARISDWAASLSLTERNGHETQNYTSSLPEYDSDSTALLAKAQRSIGSDAELLLIGDYYQQSTSQVVDVDSLAKIDSIDDKNESIAFTIDYRSQAGSAIYDSWQGLLYVSQYQQQSQQTRHSNRGYSDFNDYRFEQDIIGLKAMFNKQLLEDTIEHQLSYGIDIDIYDTKRPRLKTRVGFDGEVVFENTPQKAFPGAETTMTGIYIQDIITTNTPWSFIAAVRYDDYRMSAKDDALYQMSELSDINENAWSPKLATTFHLNSNVTFYGQWMRGFKIPPHDLAYQNHGVEPFYQILPNPALEAETSNSHELGIKGQWPNTEFSLAYYNSRFDNFIESQLVATEPTYIPGVEKSVFQYRNISSARIEGWEFSAKHWLNDSISLAINIADAHGRNNESAQPLESISPLSGSLLMSLEQNYWQHTLALRFAKAQNDVPKIQGVSTATSQGFGVVDWYSQVEIGQWRLSAGVTNLLDKEYYHYQSIAGQNNTASKEQYTQAGRSVLVNLNYQF